MSGQGSLGPAVRPLCSPRPSPPGGEQHLSPWEDISCSTPSLPEPVGGRLRLRRDRLSGGGGGQRSCSSHRPLAPQVQLRSPAPCGGLGHPAFCSGVRVGAWEPMGEAGPEGWGQSEHLEDPFPVAVCVWAKGAGASMARTLCLHGARCTNGQEALEGGSQLRTLGKAKGMEGLGRVRPACSAGVGPIPAASPLTRRERPSPRPSAEAAPAGVAPPREGGDPGCQEGVQLRRQARGTGRDHTV